MSQQLGQLILDALKAKGAIENSRALCDEKKINHEEFIGAMKAIEFMKVISCSVQSAEYLILTQEGKDCVEKKASPEAQVFNAIPAEGILKTELSAKLNNPVLENAGFGNAMKNKWIKQEKAELKPGQKTPDFILKRAIPELTEEQDEVLVALKLIDANPASPTGQQQLLSDKPKSQLLIKRQLIQICKEKFFKIIPGEHFVANMEDIPKPETDLNKDLLQNNKWETTVFKQYNFATRGKELERGHLHPLLRVRSEMRKIFFEMGFEEMKTNNFVESSFWNFDALFQPQAHPARDAHDTFFLEAPGNANLDSVKESGYLQRVKAVHESGGYGSIGYRYHWKEAEAAKNILRTHTTAVSSRTLFKLAQQIEKEKKECEARGEKWVFKPRKFFSIDRVFRNEVPDATHLCEFHQIEGMVVDKNLSLGDMIGLFSSFFEKIGIKNIRVKPAFNPYTEPSMEIFGYHPILKKTVEIGNSGMFRPEMLETMGLPSDVTVLAWGLGLERPTMIMYDIDNIRDLVGHKVPLTRVQKSPIVRFEKK